MIKQTIAIIENALNDEDINSKIELDLKNQNKSDVFVQIIDERYSVEIGKVELKLTPEKLTDKDICTSMWDHYDDILHIIKMCNNK